MSDETIITAAEVQPTPETPTAFQVPAPEKKAKKNLPIGVRILLVCASVLLCICLMVTTLATALAIDLNFLFRDDSLTKLVDQVLFMPTPSGERLSETAGDTESLIAQLIYEALQKQDAEGEAPKYTQEEINAFVEDATISDYLADKSVSYLQDFINGTENTTITTEEIETLIEDNKDLIEKTFDVTVDDTLRNDILTYVEENEVSTVIHEQVFEEVRNAPIAGESFKVGHLMNILSTIASPAVIAILAVLDLFLLVALFFSNRMRFGSTLICAGIPTILTGLVLSLPIVVAQAILPSLLSGLPQAAANVASLILSVIAPIHFAFLLAGALLLIAGIVVKCVARPKTAKA